MTKAEALRRSKAALRKAYEDTNQFDGGSWPSGEIVSAIRKALEEEFGASLLTTGENLCQTQQ